jgi:ADP-heptose:LPS heptosyltransferase
MHMNDDGNRIGRLGAGQAAPEKTPLRDPFLPGLLSALPQPPKRVAILCASRIGDFICATPGFRALRKRLPAAFITLIGLPLVRELAERSPHIDEFEPFPGYPGIAEQFFNARRTALFFSRMQEKKFDLGVQMHGSGVYSNAFTLMLGAHAAAGFVREGDGPGRLEAAMSWPSSLPAVRRALSLAVFLGAPDCGEEREFPLLPPDRRASADMLHGCTLPLIGLHPGSSESEKIWPEDRFVAAGKELRGLLGGTLIIIGGPHEAVAGSRIAASLGRPVRNLAGPASIPEMGAVISRLSLVITNDSGPAHIAYALATPSVTLFGKTDFHEWGPPDRAFHRVIRGRDYTMPSIAVKEVVRRGIEAAKAGRGQREDGQ